MVAREEINALLNKDVRLSSRNLRTMKAGPLSMVKQAARQEPVQQYPEDQRAGEGKDYHGGSDLDK